MLDNALKFQGIILLQSKFLKKYSIIVINKIFRVLIMDKTFLVYLAVGIGFLYFINSYVGDIQAEDEKYSNSEYGQEHKYDAYKGVDSIGRDILNLFGADSMTQVAAWNESNIKDEFLSLFPDFGEMKKFVDERINGDILSRKLLSKINLIEDKFFSGSITAEQAKIELGMLK